METRLSRLKTRMREFKLPAALVLNPVNVGYLSGFTGSTAALLVAGKRRLFVTDSRYRAQAAVECPEWEVVCLARGETYDQVIAREIRELGAPVIGVESEFLTIARRDSLRARLRGARLRPVADLVSELRRVKDEAEIGILREACALADRAFEYILGTLRPGISERQVAADLEHFMKRNGAQKEAFDTIVASGPRSAMPHGVASERLLCEGDFIVFDFGARVKGYNSDLTRTVVLGTASERQHEIYALVRKAQEAAVAALRPGVRGNRVDAVARDIITEAGFGENFGHGLGHGLGRLVHDHPGLSSTIRTRLKPGLVLTVEPGVYVEGWGGVRIEDDVLITPDGHDVLTHAPKDLIEVPIDTGAATTPAGRTPRPRGRRKSG